MTKPGFRLTFVVVVWMTTTTWADDREIIEGTWLTADADGWVELAIDGSELTGRIAGSPDDPQNLNPPRLDIENPDPALRGRRLLGMIILSGFQYESDGRWTGGRVYDPNNGKTYRGTIELLDRNTLSLRGFIGISLFGRSESWTRVERQDK